MKYLIWSNEHLAYWKPASGGYTHYRWEAGEYSEREAIAICHQANKFQKEFEPPNETMLPVIP